MRPTTPAAAGMFASASFARARTVRRGLQRWWVDPPLRWVAWLMLNPSTATHDRDDMTTLRLNHFTRTWGYDGWIAVNLYPFVSSATAAMWSRADWQPTSDWEARDDMRANLRDIEEAARMAALRMVAFGAEPIHRDEAWLEMCLEAFGQPATDDGADERFHCLGVSSRGQPLHPMSSGRMRVPDDRQPLQWVRGLGVPTG